MNIVDLHTHTIASGHAYSTLEENIRAAKKKGFQCIGMSDHAIMMPGTCHEFHFLNMKVIPPIIDGIYVLKGIEANIYDFEGHIDVKEEHLHIFDYIIASMHPPVITPGTKEENTRAYINVMKKEKVKIIGHPDDGRYEVDYEQFVLQAKKTKTLIELNNSSLKPSGFRLNTYDNSKEILTLCKKHQVPIIISSDAHISFEIGAFDYATKLLEEVDFPKELIVNNDLDHLNEFITIPFYKNS